MSVPAAAAPSVAAAGDETKAAPVFVTANLAGRNEVPTPGGKAVGDPAGHAHVVLRVQGNQLSFAIKWSGLSTPTAGHIHIGPAGQNGSVQIPLFGAALPSGVSAVTGTVTVPDAAMLARIATQPDAFYANLHTARFPGGAVRGQLVADPHAEDLTTILHGGSLVSIGSGDQEIPDPDGKPTGSPAGHAVASICTDPTAVCYAISWSGLTAPTAGHIHRGNVGTAGPVVVPLFATNTGLPSSITGIAGRVAGVNPTLVNQLNAHPDRFYTNLHTTQFTGGAVRGQLFRVHTS